MPIEIQNLIVDQEFEGITVRLSRLILVRHRSDKRVDRISFRPFHRGLVVFPKRQIVRGHAQQSTMTLNTRISSFCHTRALESLFHKE